MSIGLLINTSWEPGAVNQLCGFGCTEGSFVVVEAVSPFPGDSTSSLSGFRGAAVARRGLGLPQPPFVPLYWP